MKPSTKDQVEGTLHEIKGNVKEKAGQVTNNPKVATKGQARTPEQPSATLAGTVDKIIPSPRPSQPEQAQIAVDGAAHRYRDLRVDNTFTDEHGDDVKLKKGAHVDVTVTAAPKTSTATINDDR
jgi:hypothetical protein